MEEVEPRLGFGRPFIRRAFESLREPDPAARDARRRSARYLPRLITGEHVGALAMSEAGAGSDVVEHAAPRRKARRSLRAQRHQDVDHQRPRRRRARRLRENRPEAAARAASPRSSSSAGSGVLDFTEARQARHARLEHLRARLPRLRSAGGKRARRRRRGRRGADERARLRARGARRRTARHHAGVSRRGAACTCTQRKQFGQPIGIFPADAGQARRHVHDASRRAAPTSTRSRARATPAASRARTRPVRYCMRPSARRGWRSKRYRRSAAWVT